MQKIVDVHYPNIKQKLVAEALNVFYQIRDVPGLKKKPSTQRAARLAEAAPERRHVARNAERKRSDQTHPAAPRRAAQERAGRASVRTAGVPGAARSAKLKSHVAKAPAAILVCAALFASAASANRRRPGCFQRWQGRREGPYGVRVCLSARRSAPSSATRWARPIRSGRPDFCSLFRARRRLRHDQLGAAQGRLTIPKRRSLREFAEQEGTGGKHGRGRARSTDRARRRLRSTPAPMKPRSWKICI